MSGYKTIRCEALLILVLGFKYFKYAYSTLSKILVLCFHYSMVFQAMLSLSLLCYLPCLEYFYYKIRGNCFGNSWPSAFEENGSNCSNSCASGSAYEQYTVELRWLKLVGTVGASSTHPCVRAIPSLTIFKLVHVYFMSSRTPRLLSTNFLKLQSACDACHWSITLCTLELKW